MEYMVTFEDGTEGYLSHHGTKGMHWGVWNAETRARYADEGKTPQGGGGMSEEDKEEVLRENGIENMHRTAAQKQVDDDYKQSSRERLAVQAKKGNFGGDATSRVRAADGYLKARAAANSQPGFLSKQYQSKYGRVTHTAIQRYSIYARSTINMAKNGKAAVKTVMKRMQQ